jgi:hypothetical protein
MKIKILVAAEEHLENIYNTLVVRHNYKVICYLGLPARPKNK